MLVILYSERQNGCAVELRKWIGGEGATYRADAILEITTRVQTEYGTTDRPVEIVRLDPLVQTDAEMIRHAIQAMDNLAVITQAQE